MADAVQVACPRCGDTVTLDNVTMAQVHPHACCPIGPDGQYVQGQGLLTWPHEAPRG